MAKQVLDILGGKVQREMANGLCAPYYPGHAAQEACNASRGAHITLIAQPKEEQCSKKMQLTEHALHNWETWQLDTEITWLFRRSTVGQCFVSEPDMTLCFLSTNNVAKKMPE